MEDRVLWTGTAGHKDLAIHLKVKDSKREYVVSRTDHATQGSGFLVSSSSLGVIIADLRCRFSSHPEFLESLQFYEDSLVSPIPCDSDSFMRIRCYEVTK